MPKSKPKKTELAKMKALNDLGYSPHAIAKMTDRDLKTVRKYLNSEAINNPDIQVIVQKIKDAELNDLLLLNQKARANLHKRFDEGSPNVIESTAVMDRTFGQIRLLQNKSTQNISVSTLMQIKRVLEAKRDTPETPSNIQKEEEAKEDV
jgi:hypothetical protein